MRLLLVLLTGVLVAYRLGRGHGAPTQPDPSDSAGDGEWPVIIGMVPVNAQN